MATKTATELLKQAISDFDNIGAGAVKNLKVRMMLFAGTEPIDILLYLSVSANDYRNLFSCLCHFADIIYIVRRYLANASAAKSFCVSVVMDKSSQGIYFTFAREKCLLCGVGCAANSEAKARMLCNSYIHYFSASPSEQILSKISALAALYSFVPPFSNPSSSYFAGSPKMTVVFLKRMV